jgi:hypothetical protein
MDGREDEKWKVVASSDTSPDEAARKALNKILKCSINRRKEYGP